MSNFSYKEDILYRLIPSGGQIYSSPGSRIVLWGIKYHGTPVFCVFVRIYSCDVDGAIDTSFNEMLKNKVKSRNPGKLAAKVTQSQSHYRDELEPSLPCSYIFHYRQNYLGFYPKTFHFISEEILMTSFSHCVRCRPVQARACFKNKYHCTFWPKNFSTTFFRILPENFPFYL